MLQLQVPGDRAVQAAALLDRHQRVDDIAQDDVFEEKLGVVASRLGQHEIVPGELRQMVRYRTSRKTHRMHGPQRLHAEGASDGAGDLERQLNAGLE